MYIYTYIYIYIYLLLFLKNRFFRIRVFAALILQYLCSSIVLMLHKDFTIVASRLHFITLLLHGCQKTPSYRIKQLPNHSAFILHSPCFDIASILHEYSITTSLIVAQYCINIAHCKNTPLHQHCYCIIIGSKIDND